MHDGYRCVSRSDRERRCCYGARLEGYVIGQGEECRERVLYG